MGKTKVKGKKGNITNQFLPVSFAAFFILIIPLIHSSNTLDPVVFPRFTALAGGLLVFLIILGFRVKRLAMSRKILTSPFILLLTLYAAMTFVSFFYATNFMEGLSDLFKSILFLVFILMAVIVLLQYGESREIILKSLIIGSGVAVVSGVYQLATLTVPWSDPNVLYEIKGLMAHRNQFSISLLLQFPFLVMAAVELKGRWKKLAYATVGMVFVMILLLQTRAVWIAFFLGTILISVLLLVVKRDNKIVAGRGKWMQKVMSLAFLLLIVLVVVTIFARDYFPFNKIVGRVVTIFDPDYASNQWRIEMWTATGKLFLDHLWWGVGAGNWKVEIYPYYSEFLPSVFKHWRSPHNDYLLVGSEKGLPGLLLYVAMIGSLLILGVKNLARSASKIEIAESLAIIFGLAGFMTVSVFSFPSERIYPLVYVGLMASFLLVRKELAGTRGRQQKLPRALLFLLAGVLYFTIHYGVLCIRTEIHTAGAQQAYDSGDWKQLKAHAEKAYSPFVPFEPKYSFPVINYKGLAYIYADKDYKSALACFLQAHEQHPNHIRVINNIGAVYGELGDFKTSAEYYQKTLEIFPHYEMGLLNLTKAYYLQNKLDMAYQTILSCDPRSTEPELVNLRSKIEGKIKAVGRLP